MPRGVAVTLTPLAPPTSSAGRRYCDIGELPADFVATVKKHCPHVVELDLTSNGLASLPVDLADLGQLRVLKVKYNALTDVPDVVFDLAQLQTLDVAGNQIALVSENVEKLQRLQHLDLSGNRLCLLTGAGLSPRRIRHAAPTAARALRIVQTRSAACHSSRAST